MAGNLTLRNKQISPLIMLILLKVAVFIILFIGGIIIDASSAKPSTNTLQWVALQGNFMYAIKHIWTCFTYSLAEIGIMPLIGNLLWLWTFSFVVQDFSGNRHIIPLFIYATLGCAIIFILLQLVHWPNGLAQQQLMIGANVSTIAITSVALRMASDYRFFTMIGNGIPLWVMAIIFYLLQAVYGYSMGISTLICYIAAALFGLYYYLCLQRGKDLSTPLYTMYNWFARLFEKEKPAQKKGHVFYMQDMKRPPIVKKPNITEKRLNAILDKINALGIQSLTDEEKAFLQKASKQ
jgi:membrane associated rhomboid family serine protease